MYVLSHPRRAVAAALKSSNVWRPQNSSEARFDIKTGAVMGPPAGREVKSYPVRVAGTDVEIEV